MPLENIRFQTIPCDKCNTIIFENSSEIVHSQNFYKIIAIQAVFIFTIFLINSQENTSLHTVCQYNHDYK